MELLICVVKNFETHNEVSLWYGSGQESRLCLLVDTESLGGVQIY